MKTALFSILFHDMMTYRQRNDDVIYRSKYSSDSYRCNRTALQYKWLSSVMSRVADTDPEKQGSNPPRASFFFFLLLFEWVHFYGSNTPPIYCIMTVKECMAE